MKLEETIKGIKIERDSLFKERDSIEQIAENLEYKIKKLERDKRKVKTDTRSLNDIDLVRAANQEFGGDTTGIILEVPRRTTEYLVETSREFKILSRQFEFSRTLNKTYKEQLLIDSAIFVNYEEHLILKDSIIDQKDFQINTYHKATDKLLRINRRQRTGIKLAIGIGIAGLIYGISK